jgi:2-amino-4-hydroxy-6-hydroxymethyldihydropteridine diphosphokinase
MVRAFLSLGSNIGDRGRHLYDALETVRGEDVMMISNVYATEPVGGVVQDDFWNIVVELETSASPRELLERAHRAEAQAERVRDVRWGPRTLDVDVLLVGTLVSDNPEILVPHPRMWERRFVLAPLRELAPEMVPEEIYQAASGGVERLGTLDELR